MRPEIINIDVDTIVQEFYFYQKYQNETNQFVDILVFPSLVLLKKDNLHDKFSLQFDKKMFTKELGFKFNGHTYGVGKIIRLAEINNDNLHSFIKEYFLKNDIETFYKKNTACNKIRDYKLEENIDFLTFGNLKNIFRLILKTDTVFHTIEELNDDKKRRFFRQSYENYVLDRDRFTHGKLFFKFPEFEPVLRIKDSKGNDQLINYSEEIFLSNLLQFDILEIVITKMREILNVNPDL